MLPYTPLHHLLCADLGGPLVLTSGNLSDEPIAFEDDEARARLGGIADAFLAHDRPIHRRCEDSVVRAGVPVRRSRGYAPAALPLPDRAPPLVAAGAELKSTFCVARGGEAFLSPHLGDLDSEPAYRAFRADLALYLAMLGVEPERRRARPPPRVPRDEVGARAGRASSSASSTTTPTPPPASPSTARRGPALALVFDGTGYGTDGTLWGGELLRCDLDGFERARPPRAGAAARRRGGDPRAVARWPPSTSSGPGCPVPWPRVGRSSARA